MFDTFDEWDVPITDTVTIHGRSGGTGPPVVLLHGHPRTHTTWYRVAPLLAESGFTVVCPDLRGYGRSAKPVPDERHEVYCDRTMAADLVALMRALGHPRFAVAGHDRGSYVAYRTALDHPEAVTRLAVLDSVPILEALERADARFAEEWWHWFFFGASPHAERVITADPLAWYRPDENRMGSGNYRDMVRAISDPATVLAMLEDYRAGLTIDRAHDEADRAAGRTIACDTLVAWSTRDDMEHLYGDPAAVWEPWVSGGLTSARIDSGHHMAEENPVQLAETLARFLR
ncbi:alpha/beta fold hydrolase [Amycolatopsis sp. 195334CR]|uniref:alpha/beta fold hydrolase n=1 Tax=Amycolatopsis sp. 195334CR TaxID=2814588 RepID=UPI001A8CD55C|nr:alpha/beta hydrolase [Amycolatopsis sp. 195334CR]MBN6039644.1 alpha/beta hydrolase [Amycolatopsis sp. 195334CR]